MTNTSAAQSTTDQVLVIGADGTVARATLDALISRGARVRALVRRPRIEPDPSLASVEWVVGDIREPGTLRDALAGVARFSTSARTLRRRSPSPSWSSPSASVPGPDWSSSGCTSPG